MTLKSGLNDLQIYKRAHRYNMNQETPQLAVGA